MSRPHGEGPGPITRDGCAVELYALLPAGREPGIVHAAIPAGASILELGAGAGRLTHPLLALGHPVVAVDDSPEMLAHVRGGETVLGRIETLRLGRRFDAVLLASHLVNTDDDRQRRQFLLACRRHVRGGGAVLLQRHDPAWFDTAAPSRRTEAGVTFELGDLRRPGPGLLSATVAYQVGERRWTQRFTARRLDDAELAAAMAHERAHIRRRHRYVLLYAEVCRVLGRPLPGTARAVRELRFHIERDADRNAVRGRADRLALASAICKAATGATTRAGIAALGGDGTAARVRELLQDSVPIAGARRLRALGTASAALAVGAALSLKR
jgi:SAM-dependent methyltransferase